MTWGIAAYGWLWFWGFILAIAAVQQQVGRTYRLNGWHWLICALWPISIPGVIIWLAWEAAMKSKGGK